MNFALTPGLHKLLVSLLTIVGGSVPILVHNGYLPSALGATIGGIGAVIAGVVNGTKEKAE